MVTGLREAIPSGRAIYQLVLEAQNKHERDRRCEVRFPLFRPVSILVEDGRRYSAFSREISAYGIGLIHEFELEPKEVELMISSDQGFSIRVRTRIVWCEPCGEGWYISGGKFMGIAGVGGPH